MSTLNFKNAVADYRFLKNRQYSDKAALKLVGDRYRLTAVERNCLLRGVVSSLLSQNRQIKKIPYKAVAGKALGVDWFNVLITLESYLKGAVLFLADDGVVRDSSAVHGSYRPGIQTRKAIDFVCRTLVRLKPRCVDIFIDSPISRSKEIRDDLEKTFSDTKVPFPCTFTLVTSADYLLKSYPEVVASSDSVIIDSCHAHIDLACLALEMFTRFRAVTLDNLVFHTK